MITDWNTVILSKVKHILSKLDKSNVAVENISTNILSMENSVSEVLNQIGLTGDTGGSTTAGTMMAKENAIMKMLKDYDSKVKNNLIIKQTPPKNITMPSTGILKIDFDFEKPVRIIGVYFSYASTSTTSPLNFPVYIINGENSFTTNFYMDKKNGLGIFVRDNNSNVGFRIGMDGSIKIFPDIWATKLEFQIIAIQ